MLLEKFIPIFRQHETLSLPRFGHFPARRTAAGKSALPSGIQCLFPTQSETWLVHATVCEPYLNPPVCMNFSDFPNQNKAKGRTFIRIRGFRCGLRTFARTSHVADWTEWSPVLPLFDSVCASSLLASWFWSHAFSEMTANIGDFGIIGWNFGG